MESKKCLTCSEIKSIDDFHLIDSGTRYLSYCKKCSNLRIMKKYYENREEALVKFKKRYENAEYRAKDIEKSKRYYDKNPLKMKTRAKTRYLVKTGKLTKLPCKICGDVNVQAHHDDYNNPLQVTWLCKTHHAEHHRKYKELEVKQVI